MPYVILYSLSSCEFLRSAPSTTKEASLMKMLLLRDVPICGDKDVGFLRICYILRPFSRIIAIGSFLGLIIHLGLGLLAPVAGLGFTL